MIKVLTHYTPNFKELADITVSEMGAYCQKHGYEGSAWLVEQYQVYNGLAKIQQILEELEENDVALVMDCDSLVTNHAIKIESLIDEKHDLFVSRDLKGLNTGVFIVRKTNWVVDFLQACANKISNGEFDCEQNAIESFLDSMNPYNRRVKILPQSHINSYLYENYPEHGLQQEERGQWVSGKSFILHLPGMTIEKRLNILNQICPQIIR